MDMKTIIKGLFDTVKSPALRAEVIAFIRQYSKKINRSAHYACRGNQTKVITDFLKALEFEEGKDFSVVASKMDPEFNSIVFDKGGAINRLMAYAESIPEWKLALAYACANDPAESLAELMAGAEQMADAGAQSTDKPPHFITRLRMRSDEIMDEIKRCVYMPDAPNAKRCIELAKLWVDGFADTDNRPYILPLPILEVYYRMTSEPGILGGERIEPYLFFADPGRTVQRARIARANEQVPYTALAQGPLNEFSYGPGSEFCNYFCNTVKELEGVGLDNKKMVVLTCDAPMVFGEGFDDVITPLKCATKRRPLWSYIEAIYKHAYGSQGVYFGLLTNGMRVAIADNSAVWGRYTPTGAVAMNNETRYMTADPHNSERMTAKYTIIVSDSAMHPCYSDVGSVIRSIEGPSVIEKLDDKDNYDDRLLTKEETAWEWFAMTHAWSLIGVTNRSPWMAAPTEAISPGEFGNLKRFRGWIEAKAHKPKDLVRMSSVKDNALFKAVRDDENQLTFTPISALIDGAVPLALRLCAADGTLPLTEWKGDPSQQRAKDSLITNVYSGVWTTESPAIGEDNPDNVFPRLDTFNQLSSVCETTAETRNAVTNWLNALNTDGTQQIRFAKRKKGTPRVASIVVETNIDAAKFMESATGIDRLSDRLKVAIASTICTGKTSPYAVTDEGITQYSKTAEYHLDLYRKCGHWYAASFSSGSDYSGLRMDKICVNATVDSFGRLILILSISGDDFAYARLVFRWLRTMPVVTSYVRSKFDNNDPVVVIPRADYGKPESAVAYFNAIEEEGDRNGTDYVGDGAIGPEHRAPFGRVPLTGIAPRNWIVGAGTICAADVLRDVVYDAFIEG